MSLSDDPMQDVGRGGADPTQGRTVEPDPTEGRDLYEIPDRLLTGRLVLVLGAEGRGLRPGVRAAVDVFVRIPMAGVVESLNVASAAAVVLFEWARRARARRGDGDAERA